MGRLDVVVFGASGFTGRKAAEGAVRLGKDTAFAWAVAGRSRRKLEQLIADVAEKTGENLSHVKIIIADVEDEQALRSMTSQAKVLVNCCGPFPLYGESVVKACIATATHYVDISWEPEFMETMQLKYGEAARAAGVCVVHACGFDSVPNDMGVVFLQHNFGGTLNAVESYLSTPLPGEYFKVAKSGLISYGTWQSLLHKLAYSSERHVRRKMLYPQEMPLFEPKIKRRFVMHKHDNFWHIPYPSSDCSVVYRTQRYFYDVQGRRPIQFEAYVKFGNIFTSFLAVIGLALLYALAVMKFTKKLLLKYPRVCSLGLVMPCGPKESESMANRIEFELHGSGWNENIKNFDTTPPDKKMIAKVKTCEGIPGYSETGIIVMVCAVTVLNERDKMPLSGGVFTTGAAFCNTNLIQNLKKYDITFEIIKNT